MHRWCKLPAVGRKEVAGTDADAGKAGDPLPGASRDQSPEVPELLEQRGRASGRSCVSYLHASGLTVAQD